MPSSIDRKYQNTIQSLISLLKKYKIQSTKELMLSCRSNDDFKQEWLSIWKECAKNNGGKLGLGTVGTIIGSSLGGVGIAMAGTAFGAPLAAILGLGGLISGSYLDSMNFFSKGKILKTKVSEELYDKIKHDADYLEMDVEQLLIIMIHSFYERDEKRVSPVNIKP
ncbi:hypothetical protein BCT86_14435 [Vibrio breoganii]|uniref:hypothetical protein n=1 Tax=Vibrio breoganii TaxID=553239 RepID=UPI000C833ADA|nr:hypothetical protein [Vibrio breoganii]PML04919.1 hypothetical protein BCT86_14435 [Vibrio breoganii]